MMPYVLSTKYYALCSVTSKLLKTDNLLAPPSSVAHLNNLLRTS